jgi:hypothetical protein
MMLAATYLSVKTAQNSGWSNCRQESAGPNSVCRNGPESNAHFGGIVATIVASLRMYGNRVAICGDRPWHVVCPLGKRAGATVKHDD